MYIKLTLIIDIAVTSSALKSTNTNKIYYRNNCASDIRHCILAPSQFRMNQVIEIGVRPDNRRRKTKVTCVAGAPATPNTNFRSQFFSRAISRSQNTEHFRQVARIFARKCNSFAFSRPQNTSATKVCVVLCVPKQHRFKTPAKLGVVDRFSTGSGQRSTPCFFTQNTVVWLKGCNRIHDKITFCRH